MQQYDLENLCIYTYRCIFKTQKVKVSSLLFLAAWYFTVWDKPKFT